MDKEQLYNYVLLMMGAPVIKVEFSREQFEHCYADVEGMKTPQLQERMLELAKEILGRS